MSVSIVSGPPIPGFWTANYWWSLYCHEYATFAIDGYGEVGVVALRRLDDDSPGIGDVVPRSV